MVIYFSVWLLTFEIIWPHLAVVSKIDVWILFVGLYLTPCIPSFSFLIPLALMIFILWYHHHLSSPPRQLHIQTFPLSHCVASQPQPNSSHPNAFLFNTQSPFLYLRNRLDPASCTNPSWQGRRQMWPPGHRSYHHPTVRYWCDMLTTFRVW